MQRFSYTINANQDAPKVLADTLSFFGSLTVTRDRWAQLLGSLGYPPWHQYRLEAARVGSHDQERMAETIVTQAVPELGDPHPRRAGWFIGDDRRSVTFTTPGGVIIRLSVMENYEEEVLLDMDFCRDSSFASVCILARLYEATGTEAVRRLLKKAI